MANLIILIFIFSPLVFIALLAYYGIRLKKSTSVAKHITGLGLSVTAFIGLLLFIYPYSFMQHDSFGFSMFAPPIISLIGMPVVFGVIWSLLIIFSVIGKKINKSYLIGALILLGLCSLPIGYLLKKEIKTVRQSILEPRYFRMALEGSVDESNIREHYKAAEFTFSRDIYDLLSGPNRIKISSKNLPVLIELSQKNPEVQGLLANLPETPLELKLKVADSPESKAVLPMAQSGNTPPDVLLKLSKHKDYSILQVIADNKNAPPIVKYIKQIRACYPPPSELDNKCLPIEDTSEDAKRAWSLLAEDDSERVRAWVASNRNAPLYILNQMANDKSVLVKSWLLLNDSTPRHIKQKLPLELSESANELLTSLKASDYYDGLYIAKRLVKSEDITPELLDILAQRYESESQLGELQLDIARNHKTSAKTLKRLSKLSNASVISAILANPNTPLTIRQEIAHWR